MASDISGVICECLLMIGKVYSCLNILVILCAALCRSWQGLGRGLQVSCVADYDSHVSHTNVPNWLRCQWEQACSLSGVAGVPTFTYLRKTCSHCWGVHMRKQVRRNEWAIAGVKAGDMLGDTRWETCAPCQRMDC